MTVHIYVVGEIPRIQYPSLHRDSFDSVQIQAILISFQEQGIENVYTELLNEIYSKSSMTVHLHNERLQRSSLGEEYESNALSAPDLART